MLVFSIVAEYFGRGLFSTPAPPVNIQKQVGPLFSDLKGGFTNFDNVILNDAPR